MTRSRGVTKVWVRPQLRTPPTPHRAKYFWEPNSHEYSLEAAEAALNLRSEVGLLPNILDWEAANRFMIVSGVSSGSESAKNFFLKGMQRTVADG